MKERRGGGTGKGDRGREWAGFPKLDLSSSLDDTMAPAVYSGSPGSQLTVLCAGPGMGKTHAARELMKVAAGRGFRVVSVAFENTTSDQACKRVVRLSRETIAKLGKHPKTLVVFDDVTPGDESETLSEAAAIGRLVARGCQVVVSLRPEAEQLAEALESVFVLRTNELLFRQQDGDNRYSDLSAGIPSLVMALRADAALGEAHPETGARYQGALCDLVKRLLGPWLTREERRVRLAMILLGKGTMEDVTIVAGRCDSEQLVWLERDAPLFGVDAANRSFCCHGVVNDEVLASCLGVLQETAANEPQVVVRACGMLASRGLVRRSSRSCALCSSERELASVVITWGVPFVEIGAIDLVGEALRSTDGKAFDDEARRMLAEAAFVGVTRSYHEVDEMRQRLQRMRLSTSTDERFYRHVRVLMTCRELCHSPHEALSEGVVKPDDRSGLAGTDHLEVARMLIAGRFADAYACISNDLTLGEPANIFSALLCDDLMLSLMLCGGSPDMRERHLIDAANDFFAKTRLAQAKAYHRAKELIPSVLMGDSCDEGAIEEAARRAERWGDVYLQALFLAVAAVSDLHGRALSRAHVRASKSVQIARMLDEDYLASSAELVDVLSLYQMGEVGMLKRYCSVDERPPALAMLAKIAAQVAGEVPFDEVGEVVALGTPCPRDAFWAMNVLLSDCGLLSDRLSATIPVSWLDLYRSTRARQGGGLRPGGPAIRDARPGPLGAALSRGLQTELLRPVATGQRIRINVLGSFSVQIDGEVVADSLFDRRRSRDLLMVLAVAPSHRMPRYQLVDVMWPGEDYVRGPRKLYESTSEARKRLTLRSGGQSAVVSDKAQGTVGLDPSVVSFDVDEFVEEARMAISEDGDDFGVLEHARRMERVYAGGPDGHLMVLGPRVVDRVEELRMLYVDAVVAAGEAALRLGKAKLAVRYGQEAHRLSTLREDAMTLLVHALRASGRAFEIPGLYRRYAKTLIEQQGVPPSPALRRAVEMATSVPLEALSA